MGRPKILNETAKRILIKAKYKRGNSTRQLSHFLEVYEKRRLETAEKAKETSAHSQAAPLKFAKLYKNLTVEERDDFLFSDECPKYRKIPKLSPGAYIFQRPFLSSLLHSRF